MSPERILFIQTAFLGDAILTLPSLQKLKETSPACTIDVLCIPETEEVFKSSVSVDNTVVIDKKGKHKTLFKTYKFVKQLKKNSFTRVYSSHRSLRTAFIVILLEVRESFGFDNASLLHVFKNLVPYDFKKHEVQRNLDLIGYKYDDENWKIRPEISSDKLSIEKIKLFIESNNLTDGFIAIAPGSVWNTKKYPSEYFEKIIQYFVSNSINVVLIGGKKDAEDCSGLAKKFGSNVIDASGNFSIVESVELLKRAKLLISNDSAPTHMGMCAGIKVLTIYCSTVPGFGFFPYNEKSSSISFDDLQCKPCGIHGYRECPVKTFDCGTKLLPEIIIKKVEEILSD